LKEFRKEIPFQWLKLRSTSFSQLKKTCTGEGTAQELHLFPQNFESSFVPRTKVQWLLHFAIDKPKVLAPQNLIAEHCLR